ncbi:nucleoid-associated protein [Niabella soli]|uniref:Nucleoid-associated protein n=1 Tax=Niabella soli DSM 19437 TaxID=929713 RepID=W0F484_9BACT|nr:nucleoid-associated protein [Niabella soli]AHF16259.1 hypothetical protein NIASO_16085 [Niabella soli DSM 19437]
MQYFEGSAISHICVHKVGNQSEDEYLTISKKELAVDDTVKELLTRYFLNPFKSEEYFQFFSDNEDLHRNEVWTYVSAIFDRPEQTLAQSKNLAQHLYNQGTLPEIKGGEFYVVYFKEGLLNGETVDAIGLFKSENKEPFLKVFPMDEHFEVESEEGINVNKLDKGCMIFNTDKENGYIVSVVDGKSKADGRYWTDAFLRIRQRQDQYYNTESTMALYKTYVTDRLPEEYNVTRADQADLLNRSLQFFKEKQHFDKETFNSEVLGHKEYIESFDRYKQHYTAEHDMEIAENFSISPAAVKRQNRAYKSVIKLDKNFHIYIHGDRNMIEHGEDDKGRFYKLYFHNEE